jgi:FHA domain
MAERSEAVRRSARARLPRRSRKRWTVGAGIAACWLALLAVGDSATGATVLLVVLAGVGVLGAAGLRALGVTRDHPWIRRMATRPWRDGQDVLRLALRHLPEVFVVAPSGSLLAPNLVELRLNPDDVRSLSERMDPDLISASAGEVYEEQVAAHGARFAGPGPADVRIIADPSVPAGRYHLRQVRPVDADPQAGFQSVLPGPELMHPGPEASCAGPQSGLAGRRPAYASSQVVPDGPYRDFAAHDGNTHEQPGPHRTVVTDMPTVAELSRSRVPVLRLVTGDSVAETQMSGARAGRGAVELRLPEVPTVSREHARFTFSDGQWWIANLGINGLILNGTLLVGEHPLSNGCSIRWGTRPGTLQSWVEIG